MRLTRFIREERGAVTLEWVALTSGILVIGAAVIYTLNSGMGQVSQAVTAVVEDTIAIPGTEDAPVINVRMTTPAFDGSAPTANDANGIEWAAPHVGDSIAGGQITQWYAMAMTVSEIEEGRARVSMLNDEELLTLIAEYGPYADVMPDGEVLERVLCDKFHIVLNEAEARGISPTL